MLLQPSLSPISHSSEMVESASRTSTKRVGTWKQLAKVLYMMLCHIRNRVTAMADFDFQEGRAIALVGCKWSPTLETNTAKGDEVSGRKTRAYSTEGKTSNVGGELSQMQSFYAWPLLTCGFVQPQQTLHHHQQLKQLLLAQIHGPSTPMEAYYYYYSFAISSIYLGPSTPVRPFSAS